MLSVGLGSVVYTEKNSLERDYIYVVMFRSGLHLSPGACSEVRAKALDGTLRKQEPGRIPETKWPRAQAAGSSLVFSLPAHRYVFLSVRADSLIPEREKGTAVLTEHQNTLINYSLLLL